MKIDNHDKIYLMRGLNYFNPILNYYYIIIVTYYDVTKKTIYHVLELIKQNFHKTNILKIYDV